MLIKKAPTTTGRGFSCYIMGCIRSKNTKPELLVRRYLHAQGLRYRLHDASLPDKPSPVLQGRRVVVFLAASGTCTGQPVAAAPAPHQRGAVAGEAGGQRGP